MSPLGLGWHHNTEKQTPAREFFASENHRCSSLPSLRNHPCSWNKTEQGCSARAGGGQVLRTHRPRPQDDNPTIRRELVLRMHRRPQDDTTSAYTARIRRAI